ncbi:hypothetical protein GUITHDRAFT_101405 [Guillardia theta CCMP2712]|uniref:Uncharacterized protein n=1 Tax=Guillardia theta (strain CCMP2712) TaxID=905079 RepID=L1JXY5_GUITC|nr:hypothetical protein GUITHDRAFT_101405 [Guillardia theta CCMP2712]EKX52953.1 hypothetical protein GUITHDRAFT_101405 [Guillardia theta CCMP2712]|eukprot:XP_005839933.1 hypothetical protein GUITHDRAFT_101405 [Guillardia theta CCMP2712]
MEASRLPRVEMARRMKALTACDEVLLACDDVAFKIELCFRPVLERRRVEKVADKFKDYVSENELKTKLDYVSEHRNMLLKKLKEMGVKETDLPAVELDSDKHFHEISPLRPDGRMNSLSLSSFDMGQEQ